MTDFHYTVNQDQSGIISDHGDEFVPACAACQSTQERRGDKSRVFQRHLPVAHRLRMPGVTMCFGSEDGTCHVGTTVGLTVGLTARVQYYPMWCCLQRAPWDSNSATSLELE